MAGDKKRHRSSLTSYSRSPSPLPPTSRSPVRNSPTSAHSKQHETGDNTASKRNKNLSVDVCKDYTKGRCKRSPLDCKYAHPPPTVAIDENKVTVCFDSLCDRCLRGVTCRYYHPSPRIRVSLQEASGIKPSAGFLGYQVDSIRPSNLFFAPPGLPHPLPALLSASSLNPTTKPSIEVCRDYVRGRCSREAEECRYAHHAPMAGEVDYVIPVKRMRTTRDNAGDHISRGLAHQQYGTPFFHVPVIGGPPLVSPSVLQSSEASDEDRLPVCRDFQKNKCSRDSSCKYAHPERHTQVVDNYVTICRDFQRGKCKRESCRFYHQSKKHDSHGSGHAVKSSDILSR